VYRFTAHISALREAMVFIPVRTSEAKAPAEENSANARPEYFLMKQETIPIAIPITGRIHNIRIASSASSPRDTIRHPTADNRLANVYEMI